MLQYIQVTDACTFVEFLRFHAKMCNIEKEVAVAINELSHVVSFNFKSIIVSWIDVIIRRFISLLFHYVSNVGKGNFIFRFDINQMRTRIINSIIHRYQARWN